MIVCYLHVNSVRPSDGEFPEIQIWISDFQKCLGICGNL